MRGRWNRRATVLAALSVVFSSTSAQTLATLSAPARPPAVNRGRWTPAEAQSWWLSNPLPLGANFLPADAVNQLEMWRGPTFNPSEIDRELGWAQGAGLNTVRLFLHDLAFEEDPQGFLKRMDEVLTIASRHNIRPIIVLFDSCWDPNPEPGPQRPPIPGVHNSGWVQSPGRRALQDPAERPRLKAYVETVAKTFASDRRILLWDVWNEPDNLNIGAYDGREPVNKTDLVAGLLPAVFEWVRSQNPVQPLTSGLWRGGDWSDQKSLTPIEALQIANSDVISFHDYGWPETFEARIRQLKPLGRPVLCTEFLARDLGSTLDMDLPIADRADVGAVVWGLVQGRSQTNLPWDSWQRPYVLTPPIIWHHDLLRADGGPYRQREIDILRAAGGTARRAPQVP